MTYAFGDTDLAARRLALLAETFADDLPVDQSVLPHVQCHHVETEGADSSQQPADGEKPGVFALVRFQACT